VLDSKTKLLGLFSPNENCFRALNCSGKTIGKASQCEDCVSLAKFARESLFHGKEEVSPNTPAEKILGVRLLRRTIKALREDVKVKDRVIAALALSPTKTINVYFFYFLFCFIF